MSDVTQLLNAIEAGEPKAADQLLPLVYEELRKLAVVRMANEKAGQTLQPTALVHKAWLKIAGDDRPGDCRGSRPGTPHGGSALGLRPGVVEAHDSRFAVQWRRGALKVDVSVA